MSLCRGNSRYAFASRSEASLTDVFQLDSQTVFPFAAAASCREPERQQAAASLSGSELPHSSRLLDMRFAAIVGFLILLGACGSAAGDRCDLEPVGSVNAFFAGENASRDVVATVASIAPLEGLAGFRYDMRNGARLTWMAKEAMPNVVAGGTYRFVVDYRGGWPDASSILVFEGDQLIFAGVTDRKTAIPGLTITPGETTCPSRGRTKCHESLVNLPLIVGGESLYHGESARVGEFDVRVLTAQKVKDSSRCADAGLPRLSFTVTRRQ